MKREYIIVGQGIAGSLLAYFLLKQQKDVLVVDQFNPNSSSNTAAGVVNPITGRKMVKSWMVDELLPFAKSTYRELEQELRVRFFYERDILKIFASEEDRKIWARKRQTPECCDYLGAIRELSGWPLASPYGAGDILQAAWMDVPVFIRAFREKLKTEGRLLETVLAWDDMIISDKGVKYRDTEASGIIFCEGFKAKFNPWFHFIPFSSAKGEQLLIHAPGLGIQDIVNKNIYLIPKGEDHYSVGSTFVWNDLEEKITESGKVQMLEKLDRMLSFPYTIMEEKAAIRPTMKDRRPVMGRHPQYPSLYIFNGMGTKGVSLAPYFARKFTAFLNGDQPIPAEVSLQRFLAGAP